jgi:GTP cyclohydrolase I
MLMPKMAAATRTDQRPTREEAEEAVRTLISWCGDDPNRDGLLETPARVARAWEEFCRGYNEEPERHLSRTFEDEAGYDDIVLERGISFESTCEHHMVPIVGVVHVAYLPSDRIVGLSKIVRLIDGFAKRLQVQEKLTRQIADSIAKSLSTKGVAVVVEAEHECMSMRGVRRRGVQTVTSCMLGAFRDDASAREEVMALIRGR